VKNFDILWGGAWDHREPENSTLHATWTPSMAETSTFPSSPRASHSFRMA